MVVKKNDDRLPWFPCEAGKLLSALQAMRPAVGHTYTIVLLRIYEVGGPCPDSLDVLTRRTGYSKRVLSDALDVLFRSGKLVRVGDGIANPYAESVLVEMGSARRALSSRGRKGAFARHKKVEQNQQNDPACATAQAVLGDAQVHLQEQLVLDSHLPSVGVSPAASTKKPKMAKVPAGLIPADWAPSDSGLAFARENGFDEAEIRTMVGAFVDHHLSRKNRYQWDAAWRTWVRNEVKFAAERAGRVGGFRGGSGSGRGGRLTFADIARGGSDGKRH